MIVSGRVQGVYYRANVQRKAVSLGLSGWVRNLPDGDVEILAEGEEGKLGELLTYCKSNPGFSKVDGVQADWGAATGGFKEFLITD